MVLCGNKAATRGRMGTREIMTMITISGERREKKEGQKFFFMNEIRVRSQNQKIGLKNWVRYIKIEKKICNFLV